MTDYKSFSANGDYLIYCEDFLHSLIGNNTSFSFPLKSPPLDIELYPNNLYIFSNIVKHTILASDFRRLIRIIPIPLDKIDQNISIDFWTPEFHNLQLMKKGYTSLLNRPYETIHLEDRFSGIQHTAIALTCYNQTNEDLRFPKM